MRTRDTDLIVTMVDFERPGVGTHQYMSQSSFEENVINNEYFQKALEAGLIKCLLTHQGRDYADNDKSGTPYDDLLATHPDLCGVVRDVWLEGSKAMASIDLFDGQAFPAAAKLKDLIKKGTFVGVSMATECEINPQGNYDIKALLGCDFTLDNFFMGSGIVTIKKNFSRNSNGVIRINFSNKALNENFNKKRFKPTPDLFKIGSRDNELLVKYYYEKIGGKGQNSKWWAVFNNLAEPNAAVADTLIATDLTPLMKGKGKNIWYALSPDYINYFIEESPDYFTGYTNAIQNNFPDMNIIVYDIGKELPLKTAIEAETMDSNFSNVKTTKNFADEEEITYLISEHGIDYLNEVEPDKAPMDNDFVFESIVDDDSARDLVQNCIYGGQYLHGYDYTSPLNVDADYFVTDGKGHLFSIDDVAYLEAYLIDNINADDFISWCEEQGFVDVEAKNEA